MSTKTLGGSTSARPLSPKHRPETSGSFNFYSRTPGPETQQTASIFPSFIMAHSQRSLFSSTGDEFEMCLLQDARFPDGAPQRFMDLGTTKPMK